MNTNFLDAKKVLFFLMVGRKMINKKSQRLLLSLQFEGIIIINVFKEN